MFLVWNQKEYLLLKLNQYILLSYISINCSGYKLRIKSYKDLLAVEKKKYVTKIVRVYIAYRSNAWPKKS